MNRSALRAGLQDALWRAGACAGLVLGLLAAFEHPANPSCDRIAAQDCISHSFIEALMPYVTRMGAGLVLGAFLGWCIGSLVPRTRNRPALIASKLARKTARFAGRCAGCDDSISPGDVIHHRPGLTLCAMCGGAR